MAVNARKETNMKLVISTLTLALTLTTAPAALAQDVCMRETEMKAALIDWYAERPKGDVTENNEQLWVSDKTGTWTMVRSFSDGTACVVAQGADWMAGLTGNELLAALTD
jgi:hypothetical protein